MQNDGTTVAGSEIKLAPGETLWPKTLTFGDHTFVPDDMATSLETLGHCIYHTAKSKGFWDDDVDTSLSTKLMMVHCEISEAFEAVRNGNPPSEKIPGYSQVEEELADAVIRILGDCAARDLDVMGAIISKMIYNDKRPRKHGGKIC